MIDANLRITSDRLTLRPFHQDDAARIRTIVESGIRFLPPGAPAQVSAIGPWLATGVHELRHSGQGVHLAMVDDEDRIVGALSLFRTQWGAGTTEIGYGVHPLHRGRGYAAEAVRELVAWVFRTTELRRVELRANLDNTASLRVAAKAGFTREGLLRAAEMEDDGPHDLVVFGRLRHDTALAPEVFPRDELVTPRLRLRAFTLGDVPDLAVTAADPLTQSWTTVPRDYTEEHARDYVLTFTERQRADGAGIAWAAEDRVTGRYAGSVDLKATDWLHRTTEVGYMTAPWARGSGFAGEAVLAVARWLFTRQGFHRVQLRAAAGNLASQRVAEKAGFVREGVARNGGHGTDLVVYGLIPADLV